MLSRIMQKAQPRPADGVEPAPPGHWRRPPGGKARSASGGIHFNQPRLRKYHMGPTALATISAMP